MARRPIFIVHLIEDAADLAITNLARTSLTKNTIRARDYFVSFFSHFFLFFSRFFCFVLSQTSAPSDISVVLLITRRYCIFFLLFHLASPVYESSGPDGRGSGEEKGMKVPSIRRSLFILHEMFSTKVTAVSYNSFYFSFHKHFPFDRREYNKKGTLDGGILHCNWSNCERNRRSVSYTNLLRIHRWKVLVASSSINDWSDGRKVAAFILKFTT